MRSEWKPGLEHRLCRTITDTHAQRNPALPPGNDDFGA